MPLPHLDPLSAAAAAAAAQKIRIFPVQSRYPELNWEQTAADRGCRAAAVPETSMTPGSSRDQQAVAAGCQGWLECAGYGDGGTEVTARVAAVAAVAGPTAARCSCRLR